MRRLSQKIFNDVFWDSLFIFALIHFLITKLNLFTMNANFSFGQTSARTLFSATCSFNTLSILATCLFLLIFPRFSSAQIAQFNFDAPNHLVVSTKDAHVTVSDMILSTGTIETGVTTVTTGTDFPNKPYIQSSGWTAASDRKSVV